MLSNTNQKIDGLTNSVAQIKEATLAIKKHMIDEEGLVVEIDKGFEKN